MRRPLIAIPGRFSASASALRFGAVVNARKLLHAVYLAGGEPVTVYPHPPSGTGGAATHGGIGARLGWADGLLLPGGGDLDPRRYGQQPASAHLYDIDADQDAFDLAAARWAGPARVPVLAICRGVQVVNTVRGGDLEQHMDQPHRSVVAPVRVTHPVLAGALGGHEVEVSCYHHQRIGRLGDGLQVAATAGDGTVEAVVDPLPSGWLLGVQWHPEDTAEADRAQLALFEALVEQADRHAMARN